MKEAMSRFIGGIVMGFFVGAFLPSLFRIAGKAALEKSVGDTIVVVDTIRIPVPIPSQIREVGPMPVIIPACFWDTVRAVDTVTVRDTIWLPRTQSLYQTKQYKAWVSGYDPALDSLQIYCNTILIKPKREKKWGIGISAGYGVAGKVFSPFLGISLNYNFVRW